MENARGDRRKARGGSRRGAAKAAPFPRGIYSSTSQRYAKVANRSTSTAAATPAHARYNERGSGDPPQRKQVGPNRSAAGISGEQMLPPRNMEDIYAPTVSQSPSTASATEDQDIGNRCGSDKGHIGLIGSSRKEKDELKSGVGANVKARSAGSRFAPNSPRKTEGIYVAMAPVTLDQLIVDRCNSAGLPFGISSRYLSQADVPSAPTKAGSSSTVPVKNVKISRGAKSMDFHISRTVTTSKMCPFSGRQWVLMPSATRDKNIGYICNEQEPPIPQQQLLPRGGSSRKERGEIMSGAGTSDLTVTSSAIGCFCPPYLSRKISETVKYLRSYLHDHSDKYGGTLQLLEVIEERLCSLRLDDINDRVRLGMEFAYAEWMWELCRASERVGELVKVMKDAAEEKIRFQSTSAAILHWFSLGENHLSMKYEVGNLASICSRGQSVIDVRKSREIDNVQICQDSPVSKALVTNIIGPVCLPYLPTEIINSVKSLQTYLSDIGDKCGGTVKLLEEIDKTICLLHLDDIYGRVNFQMEFAYAEWLWELCRASERVGELVKVMKDAAEGKIRFQSASAAVSHWLSLRENHLSMKYEVGNLAGILKKGDLLINKTSNPIQVPNRKAQLQLSKSEKQEGSVTTINRTSNPIQVPNRKAQLQLSKSEKCYYDKLEPKQVQIMRPLEQRGTN